MTTDNTSPRYQAVLTLAVQRVLTVVADVPKAVARLEDMCPGYPSGHTGAATGPTDGPQRWQTSDRALQASKTLRDAVEAFSRQADQIERLVKQWSAVENGERFASKHETEGVCRSCIRVGEHQPVRAGGVCRWCYDTLKLVNTARRRNAWGQDLVELPEEAVRKHHSGVYGKITTTDIDNWARGKVKR